MADPHAEKLLESFFPLASVNRLVQSELRTHRLQHPIFRWWHARPTALWRSLLLAALIDRSVWEALPPAPVAAPLVDTSADSRPPDAWQRLYYRLDSAADLTIRTHCHSRQVLDLFAGGGAILAEGMRLGADVVGVDSNPLAWFTLKKTTEGISVAALQAARQQVAASLLPEIGACYRTTCPQCAQDALARHTFWVRTIACPRADCGASIPLFTSFLLARPTGRDGETPLVCPACGLVYTDTERWVDRGSACPRCAAVHPPELLATGSVDGATVTCPACHTRHDWQALLKQQGISYHMAALAVSCTACGASTHKQPAAEDLALYASLCQRLAEAGASLRLPDQRLPAALADHLGQRLFDFGFRRWSDLFNPRQLWLLARLRDAILALDDQDAAEHLLLAWVETVETYNMAATYLPGSRWTHTIYSPRPFVPWPLAIESCLWDELDLPDTFGGQAALAAAELARAQQPADLCLSPGGRRSLHPTADGILPPRSRRLLLRFPAHALEDAQLAPRSIDLAVVDAPRLDPVTITYLSDFLYVWLRTALARDYPVVFAGEESRKLPFTGQGEALTEALRQLHPGLMDDGLLVWCIHRRPDEAWGESLSPLLAAGYAVRAMHPLRVAGTAAGGIEDRSRTETLVLVVARKQTQAAAAATWDQLEAGLKADIAASLDTWWPQVEAGELTAAEAAIEAFGLCLRRLSPFAEEGQCRVMWRGQALSLAQVLDGEPAVGVVGLTRLVDRAVFRREMQLWPDTVDDVSRFYLAALLGQSSLPEERLAWRLETVPGLSVDDLQQQRLLRCRHGCARVLPAQQRRSYLRRCWEREQAWLAQPQLPGMAVGSEYLTAVDRLHLLLNVLPAEEDMHAWLAGWRGLDSLADLAQQIAARLPHGARRRRYMRLAGLLRSNTLTTEGMMSPSGLGA